MLARIPCGHFEHWGLSPCVLKPVVNNVPLDMEFNPNASVCIMGEEKISALFRKALMESSKLKL